MFELTPDAPSTAVSGRITLPMALPANGRPAVCTRIQVFGDIHLGENECSLTLPIKIKELPALTGGESLDYEYLWQPKPGMRFSAVATGAEGGAR